MPILLSRGVINMSRNFDHEDVYKQKFDLQNFKRLVGYLRPYLKYLLITLGIMLTISLAEMTGPILIQQAIDRAIPEKNVSLLNIIGVTYLGLRLLIALSAYFRTKLLNRTGQSVIYSLRKQLFNHIQKLSLRFFDGRPAGKLMTRLTSDIENLNELLTSGIVQVINEVLTLALIMGIMLFMHWQLALYTFIILPLLMYIGLRLRTYVRDRWRVVRSKRSSMNAFLQESISGMRTIQAFTQEFNSAESFEEVNSDYTSAQLKATKTSLLVRPAVEISSAIGTCIIYVAGASFVFRGQISEGVLVAFLTYIRWFWEPIRNLSNFYNVLLVAMASAERVFKILDWEPEIKDKIEAQVMPRIKGQVNFNQVRFGYDRNVDVLKGISFSIKPGQTVALVGSTGAGKSTIINLIPRFYDVLQGSITIDGYNIQDITIDSLRDQMSIVLQDPLIFSGTIRDNIAYGKPNATDEEIIEAAKLANAHDFIVEFADGYQTEVQERGSRLSVGQRQLVSFARAILADPRIIILDEATSSIDTKTEKLIQDAIQKVLIGRTSFVIAHRLSTIRNADLIMVIEDGLIAEAGTHESLMLEQGVYYNLNIAQYRSLQKAAAL